MGLLGGDRHGLFYLEQDGAIAKMIEAGVNPGPRRCQRCVIRLYHSRHGSHSKKTHRSEYEADKNG
jgi:hypothetical protein